MGDLHQGVTVQSYIHADKIWSTVRGINQSVRLFWIF